MKRLIAIFAVAAVIAEWTGSESRDSAAGWLNFEVDRSGEGDTVRKRPNWWTGRTQLATGQNQPGQELLTHAYVVPPSFLTSAPGGDGFGPAPPDPSAGPENESGRRKMTAREVLEAYGVQFGPGAWATYKRHCSQLVVCQTRDQMDLIEAVTQSLGTGPEAFTAINVRVEIYEVSARDALALEKSASEHYENTPELDAVVDLVRKGRAEFVTTASVRARSGQRAGIDSGSVVRYLEKLERKGEGESRTVIPVFAERRVGTLFEVDPVCGPTDIIDLHFKLEHHTAPPRFEKRMVAAPGTGGEKVAVELPVFSFHRIYATETMLDGTVKLLGSWEVPDRGGASRQMAFLRTDLRPVYGTDWDLEEGSIGR